MRIFARCHSYLYRYRILLRSRFSTFESCYTNFQIKSDKKIVGVIISCYNYLEYTKQAVDSYYNSIDNGYNYILIVMDNHSTDQTKAFFLNNIKSLTNICYFRYRKNMGLTQTWNDGARIALKKIKADYIFLINNDIIISKDAFDRLLTHLKDYKSVGAVGPLTNCSGYEPLQDIRRFYPNYTASDLRADIQKVADVIKENKPLEVGDINGFFMGFLRKVFEKNIYLHFLFKPYYFNPLNINIGNEDEFLCRLQQTGFKILMATDVFIFHYKDVSLHRFTKEQITLYRKEKVGLELESTGQSWKPKSIEDDHI